MIKRQGFWTVLMCLISELCNSMANQSLDAYLNLDVQLLMKWSQ